MQYFWEAFPAGSGPEDRTTYLFTYVDADQRRPSLLALMDDYWRLMPSYQVLLPPSYRCHHIPVPT